MKVGHDHCNQTLINEYTYLARYAFRYTGDDGRFSVAHAVSLKGNNLHLVNNR